MMDSEIQDLSDYKIRKPLATSNKDGYVKLIITAWVHLTIVYYELIDDIQKDLMMLHIKFRYVYLK